jgi:hypothetical protein
LATILIAGPALIAEFAALERPVVFEISPSTGTLKETAQRGHELIWIRKDNPSERRFHVSNISVGFLRSETGGQVQMTFSGNTRRREALTCPRWCGAASILMLSPSIRGAGLRSE